MTKSWQIILASAQVDDSEPFVQHFIVAAGSQDQAVRLLRKRQRRADAKILVFGPVPDQTMAFLQPRRGGVYRIELMEAKVVEEK